MFTVVTLIGVVMKKFLVWVISLISLVVITGVFIWLVNPLDLRDRVLVNQIVKMRVAPQRLNNPKNPSDYGMKYSDVNIVTADNIRLSAWEIKSPQPSNVTVIVNHPLTTTRYGSEKGLDGVGAEFLPMIKHLHEANYNVIMYDHRGQGESDGGIGSNAIGAEAPVGAGVTEWQDVSASLRYVLNHSDFSDDEIIFLSQCMGANATFLAWKEEPELFDNPQIKGIIANQPTLSYEMTDRFIRAKTGLDLVDKVLAKQTKDFGFGFAKALDYVPSLTVPVLYAQVEKDVYTFNQETGRNDITELMDATPTANNVVWIGPDQDIPFGNGQRFDAYNFFNSNPEPILEFVRKHTN
tara:strand:+ start:144 stop:1199 length:1056 start_codon:yes stop_codon:yes gene_type:complete